MLVTAENVGYICCCTLNVYKKNSISTSNRTDSCNLLLCDYNPRCCNSALVMLCVCVFICVYLYRTSLALILLSEYKATDRERIYIMPVLQYGFWISVTGFEREAQYNTDTVSEYHKHTRSLIWEKRSGHFADERTITGKLLNRPYLECQNDVE